MEVQRDLYFRACHEGWSFDVPLEEAVGIIATCLRQFAQQDWQTLAP